MCPGNNANTSLKFKTFDNSLQLHRFVAYTCTCNVHFCLVKKSFMDDSVKNLFTNIALWGFEEITVFTGLSQSFDTKI